MLEDLFGNKIKPQSSQKKKIIIIYCSPIIYYKFLNLKTINYIQFNVVFINILILIGNNSYSYRYSSVSGCLNCA